MPKSKKKKPGTGRRTWFTNIFCITQAVLFLFLWIMITYLKSPTSEAILVYFIGTLVVILLISIFNREAADDALRILRMP